MIISRLPKPIPKEMLIYVNELKEKIDRVEEILEVKENITIYDEPTSKHKFGSRTNYKISEEQIEEILEVSKTIKDIMEILYNQLKMYYPYEEGRLSPIANILITTNRLMTPLCNLESLITKNKYKEITELSKIVTNECKTLNRNTD